MNAGGHESDTEVTAREGEKLDFRAEPKSPLTEEDITLRIVSMSGSVWQDEEGNVFMGAGDSVIHLAIDSRRHFVTIVQNECGTSLVNGTTEPILAAPGEIIEVIAKPYRGYWAQGFQIISGTVQRKGKWDFVMGDEDVTISVQYLWSPNYAYGTAGRG